MGIVLEAQQGMVNRGADLSWLSQYPHEREILFGPLTGVEVLGVRTEDSTVIVIECALSINLTASTIEQVIGKRKKLLQDMADNSIVELRAALAQEIGVHQGTRCITSDTSPIFGRLYRHTAMPGFDLCESEYMKLPKRRGDEAPDEAIQATFIAFSGEEAAQEDFTLVDAMDEEALDKRVALARSAFDGFARLDPDWFNADVNYEAAVTVPLRVKALLGRPALPPMMRLFNCAPSLDSLPAGMDALEALQNIDMDDDGIVLRCQKLELIARNPAKASRFFSTSRETQVLRMFADPGVVYVCGAKERESLDIDCYHLPKLQSFVVANAPHLRSLPSNLGELAQLQSLEIGHGVTELRALPDSLCQLRSLQRMHVRGCPVSSLPSALGKLVNLRELKLLQNHRLTSLPAGLADLTALTLLDLRMCSRLTSLPSRLGNLAALETLILDGCRQLPVLPESIGQLVSLRTLRVQDCFSLSALPASLAQASALKELEFTLGGGSEYNHLRGGRLAGCGALRPLTSAPQAASNAPSRLALAAHRTTASSSCCRPSAQPRRCTSAARPSQPCPPAWGAWRA